MIWVGEKKIGTSIEERLRLNVVLGRGQKNDVGTAALSFKKVDWLHF
jgi:hypothetical protein